MHAELQNKDSGILTVLAQEMLNELKQDILPFWMYRAADTENGGFYGEISNDLIVHYKAPKGGILNSRILWTFSSAYRIFGEPIYLNMAQRAYRFLCDHFWDDKFGGVYWMVDYKGKPINDRKQAYNLAFAIYGLSEYYRVSSCDEALKKAIAIFDILEAHYRDSFFGGYIEALTRDYKAISDMRLSDKDRNDIKSMNTHLHILEAYTSLLRVWRHDRLVKAQQELLDIMLTRIVDQDTHRFKLFFNEQWKASSQIVSFGHDIEGSWLMCEAAEVLGEPGLKSRAYDEAAKMAYVVLNKGLDTLHGGLFNEEEHGHIDTDKHWWPQAEAVVGFANAYSITLNPAFLKAAAQCWSFIKSSIIDKKCGEWYWKTDRAGEPYLSQPKVEPWKCPYHNSRACMEIIERASQRV
ncbi:MAG: AGE family epimerase/isomerase [Clostridia bacterium]|nr:AGE family epimerase/isomerase [Clostridia bacterium]